MVNTTLAQLISLRILIIPVNTAFVRAMYVKETGKYKQRNTNEFEHLQSDSPLFVV